ncbi:hypothetical protein [Streptomyces roseoverticillatus]|uniref:Uncharacterized protein n=1 Tax=Streptomyces roseoverticillatus TaxID=66429 RepID=A0ABV3IZ76_9ACTN
MSVYTPSAAPGTTAYAQPAQQNPQQTDVLKALPYIAALASASPGGQQAGTQQMRPQSFLDDFTSAVTDVGKAVGTVAQTAQALGPILSVLSAAPSGQQAGNQQMHPQWLFGLPDPQEAVNAINTAAGVANQAAQWGHQLGMFSAGPSGQQAGGQQMRPQSFLDDFTSAVTDVGKAVGTVAQTAQALGPILSVLSAAPSGQQAGNQQMHPQWLFGLPDPQEAVNAINTAAGVANQAAQWGHQLGMFSAGPSGQQAGGQQMRPQSFLDDFTSAVTDVGKAIGPVLPLLMALSASPAGQPAGLQTAQQ